MIICPWKDIARYAAVIPGLQEAVDAIAALTNLEPATIPLSGTNKILVQKGVTKPAGAAEAHREYLDVQLILEGGETMGWADVSAMTLEGEFNTVKDKGTYTGSMEFVHVPAGYCYVVFPEDAHRIKIQVNGPQTVSKVVFKVLVYE